MASALAYSTNHDDVAKTRHDENYALNSQGLTRREMNYLIMLVIITE